MMESIESTSSEIPPAERELLAGAERRMARGMWALGVPGIAICWFWGGWSWGGGFAIGAVLSALNFHWMKTAVGVIAEAASSPESASAGGAGRPKARSVWPMVRFALRYALIGVAGYVIFKSSFLSLRAFFLGLFLFLGAILVEMAYQVCSACKSEP